MSQEKLLSLSPPQTTRTDIAGMTPIHWHGVFPLKKKKNIGEEGNGQITSTPKVSTRLLATQTFLRHAAQALRVLPPYIKT